MTDTYHAIWQDAHGLHIVTSDGDRVVAEVLISKDDLAKTSTADPVIITEKGVDLVNEDKMGRVNYF